MLFKLYNYQFRNKIFNKYCNGLCMNLFKKYKKNDYKCLIHNQEIILLSYNNKIIQYRLHKNKLYSGNIQNKFYLGNNNNILVRIDMNELFIDGTKGMTAYDLDAYHCGYSAIDKYIIKEYFLNGIIKWYKKSYILKDNMICNLVKNNKFNYDYINNELIKIYYEYNNILIKINYIDNKIIFIKSKEINFGNNELNYVIYYINYKNFIFGHPKIKLI